MHDSMHDIRLREIRKARGYTQNKLAMKSGLSRQAIVVIESGQKSPTLNTLAKIANALDVTVSQLIGESDLNVS
jgi:transcriptional regulator with XRE-family HTH domain